MGIAPNFELKNLKIGVIKRFGGKKYYSKDFGFIKTDLNDDSIIDKDIYFHEKDCVYRDYGNKDKYGFKLVESYSPREGDIVVYNEIFDNETKKSKAINIEGLNIFLNFISYDIGSEFILKNKDNVRNFDISPYLPESYFKSKEIRSLLFPSSYLKQVFLRLTIDQVLIDKTLMQEIQQLDSEKKFYYCVESSIESIGRYFEHLVFEGKEITWHTSTKSKRFELPFILHMIILLEYLYYQYPSSTSWQIREEWEKRNDDLVPEKEIFERIRLEGISSYSELTNRIGEIHRIKVRDLLQFRF